MLKSFRCYVAFVVVVDGVAFVVLVVVDGFAISVAMAVVFNFVIAVFKSYVMALPSL